MILRAFKTSPTKVMEIEAAISLPKIPFKKKVEFDSAKFLKWNDLTHPETDNENERIQISDSKLDFSNDEIHRRKKRKKRKEKKKIFPNQLIRFIARLRRINPELAK